MSPSGFLVIDKPAGITSRDAVNQVQRWFPRGTKVGHAGTLDPLATGVLVIGVGQGTRLVEYVQRMHKVYRAGIRLGATSDTDDAEGNITPRTVTVVPGREDVAGILHHFVGDVLQTPPAFSALKTGGRRAHELARRGESVDLAPRPVTVHDIQLLRYDYPDLDLVVRCGKGTYIRSLARDLGALLCCGGYIASLQRTEIGRFTLADAFALDNPPAASAVLPLSHALADLNRLDLASELVLRMVQGQSLSLAPGLADGEEVVVCEAGGPVRLIARWNAETARLHPHKVLAHMALLRRVPI